MSDQNAKAQINSVVDAFAAEVAELYNVLATMDTGFWTARSTFKEWTVWDVVAHLHLSDHMALTSIRSAEAFRQLMADLGAAPSMREFASNWLMEDGHSINGPKLLQRWKNLADELCDALRAADPDERFVWAGPGMKARMFGTARQMETWAHAWEIFDLMKLPRTHTDRLKNISEIGVRTFGWTFNNRKLPVPEPAPLVRLTAPSGEIWEWNSATQGHKVEGSAVEFCQVVTQVRNIADTALQVEGDNAIAWMAIAQCFAGPPEEPPAPGTRVPA